jgi:FAD synthase
VKVDTRKRLGSAVAVVGEWDPLTPTHRQLFQQLKKYAMKINRLSVVIMLDPPPPSFIPESPLEWPVYHHVDVRRILIEDSGVDGTLIVQFEAQDLDTPVRDFFEMICEKMELDELLLGARQTLGRGRESSNAVVEEVALQAQVKLTRLPPTSGDVLGRQARNFVRGGHLKEAVRIIGQAPVWARPPSGELRLSWPSGAYVVEGRRSPIDASSIREMEVSLSATARGCSSMEWPDPAIDWLAFIAGPSDK